jgi:hypothetical protein
LLRDAVAGKLDEQVRDRIVAETHGNPLGLVELSRAMSPRRARRRFRQCQPRLGLRSAERPLHATRQSVARVDTATHVVGGSRSHRRCHCLLACSSDI